jgi:hypothetical protein
LRNYFKELFLVFFLYFILKKFSIFVDWCSSLAKGWENYLISKLIIIGGYLSEIFEFVIFYLVALTYYLILFILNLTQFICALLLYLLCFIIYNLVKFSINFFLLSLVMYFLPFVVYKISNTLIRLLMPITNLDINLQGVKALDFADFSKIVKLINNKAHLTLDGLAEIKIQMV